MKQTIQFSVTRKSINLYHIIVQDDKEIIRSYDSTVSKVLDDVGHEIEQLKSIPGQL